ncbi:hypothetical protein AAC03nite_20440 [Alicyclobacillus acidoterrestris]|nr:hypothetical protein AAC03nite_20440 [Alicyclobacillus acidoterrestris]
MTYEEFLRDKALQFTPSGFDVSRDALHSTLFDYQRDIVAWALKRGKAAIFANTGLGKTLMQLEWARHVHQHTGGKVLILTPLAVSAQTAREAEKIDLTVHVCQDDSDIRDGLNITNYEKLHRFDPTQFTGVVLDESSLLKAYDGKMRNMIIDSFKNTPYKLACTATPAPNDYMELGNHSEFLGVMSRVEMLAMFFVHDGGDTSKWRLKGHAEEAFWKWLSSWGVMIRKPSDLGYDDGEYELPPLNVHDVLVETNKAPEGYLFAMEAQTLQERQTARRSTIEERCKVAAEIVNASDRPFLVWCDFNSESLLMKRLIPGAVEVKGSDSAEHKEKAMLDFAQGNIRVLISKSSICGFGMNWQHCADMVFVGVSDSFEMQYQAIRRCYRFGQTKPVNVYMVTSDLEGAVAANVKRKEADFERMQDEMSKFTRDIVRENVKNTVVTRTAYKPKMTMIIPNWLRSESA